jgi:AraC-like DNA-binding protein
MHINLEKLTPNENSTYLIREYAQSSFKSPRHFHEEFELTYIEESYGKLYIGNSIIDFRKGDLFLFAPRLIHCFKNPKGYEENKKGAKAICVWFMPDFLGSDFISRIQTKMLNALFQKSEVGLMFPKPSADIIDMLKSIRAAKNLNGLINLLIILDKLSLHKNATILSDTRLIKYYYKHSKDDRIEKVMDYVSRNYHRKITAKEVALLIKMSEAGFSRFFKSRTEINFTGYVNDIRLSEAQKLLIETKKPIHDISNDCGYDNLSYFNRQFKSHNNMSPKVFREYFINTNSEGA